MAIADNIMLGEGVFTVNGNTIALVRGGGKFMVEREYKIIEADGDICPVVGRIRKDKSVAKLEVNALEFLEAKMTDLYPSIVVATGEASTGLQPYTVTGGTGVLAADYSTSVTFVGKTKAGQAVTITLNNAINLENLEWDLIDKDEVVAKLTFTACASEGTAGTRQAEPWSIAFVESTDS